MRTKTYAIFWIMIFIGFALISFSFPRFEPVHTKQLIAGCLIAVIGICGCVINDQRGESYEP